MKKIISIDKAMIFFILISSFVFLFYFFKAMQDIRFYLVLDRQTQAHIVRWQLDEEKKSEKVILGVLYEYVSDGVKYEGQTIFRDKNFLNLQAAKDEVGKLSKRKLLVSYSSENPNLSYLDYHFKVKRILYSAISLAVLIYFIILGRKLKKFE